MVGLSTMSPNNSSPFMNTLVMSTNSPPIKSEYKYRNSKSPPLSPGSESDSVNHIRPPSSSSSIGSRCSTANSEITKNRPQSCPSPSPSPSTSSTKDGSVTNSAPNPCAELLKPKCNCPELERVDCRLENKDLWDRFHELGTEMIITKTGRYEHWIIVRLIVNIIIKSNVELKCRLENAINFIACEKRLVVI